MREQELYLLVTRYLSGQTSDAENAWLMNWMAADKRNQQDFDEIKRVWQEHQRTTDEQVGEALSVLRARIAADEQRPAPVKAKRVQLYWLTAAAGILGMVLTTWYLFTPKPTNQLLSLKVITRPGERKTIVLADSTRVVLGPESELAYPAAFDKDNRTVSVKGQAYFEVSQAPHRPFVVETSLLSVQVLGTHFNVQADPKAPTSTVALLEGAVKVKLKGEQTYLLKPGQEISVDRHTNQIALNSFDSTSVLAWQQNVLIFKNEAFGSVAARIEKMYGVKIVFNNGAAAATHLYAQFKNEPLDAVMAAICTSGVLTYRQQGDTIYVNMKTGTK